MVPIQTYGDFHSYHANGGGEPSTPRVNNLYPKMV